MLETAQGQLSGVSKMLNESDFAGKWKVVEAMDLADDYLSLTPDPHLLIEVNSKNEVTGNYQYVPRTASLMASLSGIKMISGRFSPLKAQPRWTRLAALALQALNLRTHSF